MNSCRCVHLSVWSHADGTNSFSEPEARRRVPAAGPVVAVYAKPWYGCQYVPSGHAEGRACPPDTLAARTDADALAQLAPFVQR